jgi:hypothetical protein
MKSKNALPSNGGLILGYELTEKIFHPVLELAGKGMHGWKLPTFIESIADNPAPLLLEDRWLYDEVAINTAFAWLKTSREPGMQKLQYVFKESNRFEPISMQKYINTTDDVDAITTIMRSCNTPSFRKAIQPLEVAYGDYASPNNYEFERMNAGILGRISSKYPNLQLLDDSLRIPVYECLGNTSQAMRVEREAVLEKVIYSAKSTLYPIPQFPLDWDPVEFIKIQKSKGARQLRELIHSIRLQQNISDQGIVNLVQRARMISDTLSPTREVIYALCNMGTAVLSALQVISLPIFYIPTAIFTAVSADQLYNVFAKRQKQGNFQWLELVDQLALWYKQK